MDNAVALASGLRSVEKRTRKALLRLESNGHTNTNVDMELLIGFPIGVLDESFITFPSDGVRNPWTKMLGM